MSPNSIWPPNKTMTPVTATVTSTDNLAGIAGFVLQSLATNEGNIARESSGWTLNAPSTRGQLLADRNGDGNGRVYTFTYLVSDQAGNSGICTGTVTVPHDKGR
jgi:hypothetical protein